MPRMVLGRTICCTAWLGAIAACTPGPSARHDAADEPQRPTVIVTLHAGDVVPTEGDTDGSGEARLTLAPARLEICYELAVLAVEQPTEAHLHLGASGYTGPVVASFGTPGEGWSAGCSALERVTFERLLRQPREYYIDVHSEEFPQGALRGQLAD